MRFFRGIAVPADQAEHTVTKICEKGLTHGQGWWLMEHEHPGDLAALFAKCDLSIDDTRSGSWAVAAVCGCGDEMGAAYYACNHNRSSENNTPIIIEFEAEKSVSAVDGKDFLYTVFQGGDPERARTVLERTFGKAVLRYAERAWSSEEQSFRIAMCDLAIHDLEVIEAHHRNELVLAGRHGTIFKSAFTIALPVSPGAIISINQPVSTQLVPQPDIRLDDVVRFAR